MRVYIHMTIWHIRSQIWQKITVSEVFKHRINDCRVIVSQQGYNTQWNIFGTTLHFNIQTFPTVLPTMK